MISWSNIREEYEGLETGFRERVVALFHKYEGQETDEKVRGKVVLVTVTSFSSHMGIARKTFDDWVRQANTARRDSESADQDTEESCMNEGVPPARGLVHEATLLVRKMVPYLNHVSPETHMIIEEDLEDLETAIAEVRAEIRKAYA